MTPPLGFSELICGIFFLFSSCGKHRRGLCAVFRSVAGGAGSQELLDTLSAEEGNSGGGSSSSSSSKPWFFNRPGGGGGGRPQQRSGDADVPEEEEEEEEEEDVFLTSYSNNSHWYSDVYPSLGKRCGPSAHVAYYDAASLYPSSGKTSFATSVSQRLHSRSASRAIPMGRGAERPAVAFFFARATNVARVVTSLAQSPLIIFFSSPFPPAPLDRTV